MDDNHEEITRVATLARELATRLPTREILALAYWLVEAVRLVELDDDPVIAARVQAVGQITAEMARKIRHKRS
jgi:hypothetical protein